MLPTQASTPHSHVSPPGWYLAVQNGQKMDQLMKEQVLPTNPMLVLETPCGDLDSFNHLVLAYQDSLFNVALRILGDTELAADATQEAFISAFRSLNSYRGGSLKAWLMRIVTNACYDELRRQKRHPTLPLEPIDDDGEEIETPRWLADSSMLPEEKLEAAELERAIQRGLDALPINFRTMVVLVDIMGMNYSEVASAASVPLGTVKSRLARARLRLRESLRAASCDVFETLDHYT